MFITITPGDIISPFSILGNWSSERLSNLPTLTQLLYDEAQIWIQPAYSLTITLSSLSKMNYEFQIHDFKFDIMYVIV